MRVVAAVGRAGKVHRGGERCPGMCLGILRVRPSHTEVLALEEVRAAFLAGLVDRVVDGQVAVELVLDHVP